MIEVTMKKRWRPFWRRRRPLVLATFAFRYDAHLVPAMIENIAPLVDGWVSLDNRKDTREVSIEGEGRQALLEAAHAAGAEWILAVDPDERFEAGMVAKMEGLTAKREPLVWGFNLREMYSTSKYRVDGIWGQKVQWRLFPLFDELFPIAFSGRFSNLPYHRAWYPLDYRMEHSGLNLYHLKMITPARREARRDLYNHLDPLRELQPVGYDYLADDSGAAFEEIPSGRGFSPPHLEDNGLWMPAGLAQAKVSID